MIADDDLDRFVVAQEGVFETALAELRAGRKKSHWIWFVCPQLRGLGSSETARFYGLRGADEAIAHAAHPLLGPRLVTTMRTLLEHRGTNPERILGPVDALKLRSCATVFASLPGADPVFAEVLGTFFGGMPCERTQAMLAAAGDFSLPAAADRGTSDKG